MEAQLRRVRIVLIGLGNLGCRFVGLLADKREELIASFGLEFVLVAAADSKGAAVSPQGLDGRTLVALKERGESVAALPGVGRLGMTGLQLLEAVDADALCEASPVHIEAGAEPGLSHIRTALKHGMHVVTPNKGPIVLAHQELVALAREHGVMLRFDGTVAGGLPALNLGTRDLRGALIHRIEAVPNLTTGFVLDLLVRGATMDEAIEQAGAIGALEADPNWDLDGWDAAAKLVILAKAVLGVDASLQDVRREGIRNVDVDSLRKAHAEGRLVRLVAIAERLEDGTYAVSVAPIELPSDHPLGRLGEKEMGIVYETDIFGRITALINEPTPLPSAATMLRDLLDIYG